MLPPRIRTSSDLVTSKEATTHGFVMQAREKVRQAVPYIQRAEWLRQQLSGKPIAQELRANETLRRELLAAIGLSEKAIGHLTPDQTSTILAESLEELQRTATGSVETELVYRYLLTSGDSLGGKMRNLTGAGGKEVFVQAIVAALDSLGYPAEIDKPKGAIRPRSILWKGRVVVFDRKPRIVDKNVDAILLDTNSGTKPLKELFETKSAYVACGEIKGGIDPAGADEHWKTAHAALERIRTSFGLQRPALFFAGAAIEQAMAREILSQLRDNRLTYAANLTKPEQMEDLARWLVSL